MRREETGALGSVGYSWADATGKGFLFELDEATTDSMKGLFETTICRSAWEAAQKTTFPEDGDLEELTERHLRSLAPLSIPTSVSTPQTEVLSAPKDAPASHWAGAPPSPIRTTDIKIGKFFFSLIGILIDDDVTSHSKGSILFETEATVEGSQVIINFFFFFFFFLLLLLLSS